MRFILISFMAMFLAACSSNCIKSNDANVMVMIDDASRDTVSSQSSVSSRAVNEVQRQLSDAGYTVYDETSAGMGNFDRRGLRLGRAELLDMAASANPDMDVAAIVSVYADVREKPHAKKFKVRVEGDLIAVHSGKRIASFDSSSTIGSADRDCSHSCMKNKLGDKARIAAADLGAVLTEQLQDEYGSCDKETAPTSGYVQRFEINLEGFTVEQANVIEAQLEDLSGYDSHRLSYQGYRKKELSYKTTLPSFKLKRHLHKILEHESLRARIQFSGNRFDIQKTINIAPNNTELKLNGDQYDW